MSFLTDYLMGHNLQGEVNRENFLKTGVWLEEGIRGADHALWPAGGIQKGFRGYRAGVQCKQHDTQE